MNGSIKLTQYILGIHNITSVIDIHESLVDDTLLSITYCMDNIKELKVGQIFHF